MLCCLFTHAAFFTRRVHAFQDLTGDFTYFRKNKFPVFSCTAILWIFPSLLLLIIVNAKVVIREWFLLHLSGKFVSSFYDPLNKIILGKYPVVGRGQFLDRQHHPLNLMQKGNDISVLFEKVGNQSLSG